MKTSKNTPTDFELILERGAFHYDKFVLTPDKIIFLPDTNLAKLVPVSIYRNSSVVKLDNSTTMNLYREI